MNPRVFISVGTACTTAQANAVEAIFQATKTAGLDPRQMEKNEWSFDQPLRAIRRILKECDGAVVIAFSRSFFPRGSELTKAGEEEVLESVRIPTVWNQIEAAMGCMLELPLLVVAERGLREEGLLEGRYDWKVFWTDLDETDFKSEAFQGFLATWKVAVIEHAHARYAQRNTASPDVSKLTIGQLISHVSLPQLWSLAVAIFGTLTAVATVGYRVGAGVWPWS